MVRIPTLISAAERVSVNGYRSALHLISSKTILILKTTKANLNYGYKKKSPKLGDKNY
jgi:hypothetical protein